MIRHLNLLVMKRSTKNKLRMYKAVNAVLAANETSWTGLPAFETAQTAFSEKLALLLSIAQAQEVTTIGVAKHKEALRAANAKALLKIAKGLRAFALDNGMTELSEQLKITHSTLRYGPETETLIKMKVIIENATEHIAALADYGISPARLADATALNEEFEILVLAPRKAIVDRKGLTSSIGELENALDALLKHKLDLLMALMETDHQTFFKAYFDTRIVVDLGFGGHKSAGETPESGGENQLPFDL